MRKIIIDSNTNKILRYGEKMVSNKGEYVIERDTNLHEWEEWDVYYNPLRETFYKGNNKQLVKLVKETAELAKDTIKLQ